MVSSKIVDRQRYDIKLTTYKHTLACINLNASTLTRRSAGLPSMITGILAAHSSGKVFDGVILDLQAIADTPSHELPGNEDLRLPQVHALNCLKDIFSDTRFGSSTELHAADTLDIAASCLESEV